MDFPLLPSFIAAVLAGYLLGSIPFALLAGKLRGVDVFRTGSRSAGTANVFWNVGRRVGIAVLVGDVAKASAAVLFAQFLGLPWPLVLVVGGACVLGHWNSVFSRFRGGDGMAALMGVAVTLEPVLTVLGGMAGACVLLLLWRSSLRGPAALAVCFMTILIAGRFYHSDLPLVVGLTALGASVFFHSLVFPRRKDDDLQDRDSLGADLDLAEEPDLGAATTDNG